MVLEELLLVEFPNLLSISISANQKEEKKVTQLFLKGVMTNAIMLKLYKVFVKGIFSIT